MSSSTEPKFGGTASRPASAPAAPCGDTARNEVGVDPRAAVAGGHCRAGRRFHRGFAGSARTQVAFLSAVALMVLLGLTGLAVLSDSSRRSETLIKGPTADRRLPPARGAGPYADDRACRRAVDAGKVIDDAPQMAERFRQASPVCNPRDERRGRTELEQLTRERAHFAEIVNRAMSPSPRRYRHGRRVADRAGAAGGWGSTDKLVQKAEGEMAEAIVAAAAYRTSATGCTLRKIARPGRDRPRRIRRTCRGRQSGRAGDLGRKRQSRQRAAQPALHRPRG